MSSDNESNNAEEGATSRKRTLTEKGLSLQVDANRRKYNAKRSDLSRQRRRVLYLKGESDSLTTWKREFGHAQVIWDELKEIFDSLSTLMTDDEDIHKLSQQHDKDHADWDRFESDARSEMEYLQQVEQIRMENSSVTSGSSRKSSRAPQGSSVRSQSVCSSSSSLREDKLNLQKEEALLKAKLVFMEEERRLRLQQLEEEKKRLAQEKEAEIVQFKQQEKLHQLQLKKDLAEKQAQLDVLWKAENEHIVTSEHGLQDVPVVDKVKDFEKFFQSQDLVPPPSPVNASSLVDADIMKEVLSMPKSNSAPEQMMQENDIHHEVSASISFNPDATSFSPKVSPLEKCITQLTEASMIQNDVNKRLIISSQLPKISVPVFNGDPLQYPLWRNSFSALIDNQPLDATTKLNYLNQYVSGKPKLLVEHYMLIGTDEAYVKARDVLAERYGNSSVVSTAFINKLHQWPKISPRDAQGLRQFSDFLGKVEAARPTTPSLGVLDYACENILLIDKLPYHLEGKWRDKIERWRANHSEASYPPFSEFDQFLRRAANKANMPEFEGLSRGRENSRPSGQYTSSHTSKKGTNASAQAFATTTVHGDQSSLSQRDDACPHCSKSHHLEDCKSFSSKSFLDRKNFFFRKRLCMGCGESTQHQVKDCGNRKTCKVCNGRHLTSLHRDPKKPSTDSPEKEVIEVQPRDVGTSNCTRVCAQPNQGGEGDHCMIIPVIVRSADNPHKESKVYAVLDDQSNSCFITKVLCEQLDLQGPETQLLLTTMHEQNACITSNRIFGLEVLDLEREHVVKLPVCFKRDSVPAKHSQIPKTEVINQWSHLKQIAGKLMPYDSSIEISLLIGSNCPSVVRPRQIVAGGEDDPYGQRSLLGWGVIGRVCKSSVKNHEAFCNKTTTAVTYHHFAYGTKVKEIFDSEKVLRALESDFQEKSPYRQPYSVDDQSFMSILENGTTRRQDGHYEMPLPLKTSNLSMPDNRRLAEKRWLQLQARFRKNPKLFTDYQTFMKDVVTECAERVPKDRLGVHDGRVNYIPHTGVYHPKKPDKIRVVFDCSARFEGVSLNDHLLQGPDLMNRLIGVLCRFRQEEVAFMVDIKSMFHQFFVEEKYRDLLRFLWWEDGDPNKEVIDYRMKVHLFGAGSSPGCANFGLKRAADDGEEKFGPEAANFIRRDFYVDDGLKSVPSVLEAVALIKSSQAVCASAGLKLHRIMSNRREVLESVPEDERAKGLKDLDLKVDPLPIERVLGVTWCVENDTFGFRIELKDRPLTRRGILSTVSSIYDPNGYVAPVTLIGKQILQQMCKDQLDWDSPLPNDLRPVWEKWRSDIHLLEKLHINRCFKPGNFGHVKAIELHHFSDASEYGYGQCSYLRQVNEQNRTHLAFVIGKARVTPLKQVTIPRLELTAATISARISEFLRAELSYQHIKEYFWTDSKIVLGYVKNEAKRFHIYVANRVQQIRESTNPESWLYVNTVDNPADEASRGLTAKQLVENCKWLSGPDFLWKDGPFQCEQPADTLKLDSSDPNVRSLTVLATKTEDTKQFPKGFEICRLDRFSRWHRACKAIALCLRLRTRLYNRGVKLHKAKRQPLAPISVIELQSAEKSIVKIVQLEHFAEELQVLQKLKVTGEIVDRDVTRERNNDIKKTSSLYRLDPYLDEEGVLRVGGRIDRANIPRDIKHPIILPRKSHVTELLARRYHEKVNHMGRGITHNEIRQSGYWLIGGSSAVSNLISKCVTCRRLRGSLQTQKMSELPEDRLNPAPPFSYCAVDYFGPFYIKEKRSEVKRWGVLFTCMASRSVHLETVNSLTASAFINALSRFQSRRGPIRQLRSDQGTTFVGARNELREALANMDQDRVQEYLLENNCEWIQFKMNVPHSSHMGGVWERQIGTVRNVLETLLTKSGSQLDDEAFRTFMTEVECIVNSRPLTTESLCSPDGPEPLTPNHLLTMKPKIVLPPPGKFQQEDLYSRRWWRRVQYLANEFWLRWRKEFLHHLQLRQKWVRPEKNLQVGDVVISKEKDETRNQWPLARVEETLPSIDGRVRKVKILMADGALDNQGKRQHSPSLLERPVHKLVLLLSTKDSEHQGQ